MIKKTEAIVLRTQKFRETSLLTTCYTLEGGIKNFIVQGYRSAKGKRRHSYFQPLSCIDIVYYSKDSRDFQKITESSVSSFFHKLQTEPQRIALGLLIIEVFRNVVKEEERNDPLFALLKKTLTELDTRDAQLIHIVLWFFLQLTMHLGFQPGDETKDPEKPVWFDVQNGKFIHAPTQSKSDQVLCQLLKLSLSNCGEISFTNLEKREMIRTLFMYYALHVEGFKEPESLKVFAEIWS